MHKDTGTARQTHSVPRVVSPRNKVTVALPLSMIRTDESAAMRARDWISVAGVVVSAIGFTVAVRRLARIADALEAGQASRRANQEAADSLADGSWSPAQELPRDRAGASGHGELPEKDLVAGSR